MSNAGKTPEQPDTEQPDIQADVDASEQSPEQHAAEQASSAAEDIEQTEADASEGSDAPAEQAAGDQDDPFADLGDDSEVEPEDSELIAQLRAELNKAQSKADESWETLVRLQAEMDNLRKRNEKQIEDAHKFGSQKFVEALLPVIDSLEMGMVAEGDVDQIREGMGLTMKQFESVMEKFNIEVLNPLDEKFNPELHQAMGMQPDPERENNIVSAVMQKGFTLSGRLVRPAMVMVVKN